MSRCPYCGQKECCGADLSPKLDKLVEALQLIKSDYEGTRDVAGLADRTHAYYETACVALRELEENNHEQTGGAA